MIDGTDGTVDPGATDGSVAGVVLKDELEVDGVVYTPEEIRSLSERATKLDETKAELLTDYHKKMEENKQEREDIVKLRTDVTDFATKFRRAKDEDILFYTTHSAPEYDGYKSKVNELLGGGEKDVTEASTVVPSTDVLNLKEEVSELRQTIKDIKTERETEKTEKETNKVDASIKKAEALIAKEYPYADLEAVQDGLFKFFHVNRRVPTDVEVRAIVKKRHDRVAGLEVIRKGASNPRLPSPKEGFTPQGLPEKPVKLSDLDGQIEAGKQFFASRNVGRV